MQYLGIPAGFLAVLLFFGEASAARAEVKMPVIFGDHMVLQEGINLQIWGMADPGEAVTVQVGNESGTTTTGVDGKWLVKLAPLPEGTAAVTMTVTGKNSLKFADVLIGDVWLCSGQSNMTLGLAMTSGGKEEMARADIPLLRLFVVPQATALTPADDLKANGQPAPLAHWMVCSPDAVANAPYSWGGFSAVAYYFGREIQKNTGGPVGLIHCSVPGTPAEAWTSLSGLQKNPALQHEVEAANQIRAKYPQAAADYPAQRAAYREAESKWKEDPANVAANQAWDTANAKALAAGQAPPPRPHLPGAPEAPMPPDGGTGAPANLFNGMIAPLIPYGLKGVIWYQGENDSGTIAGGEEYQTLFGSMITDWREKWGQGDFPFVFVQLAATTRNGPADLGLCLVREAQLKTLALPNTGMAVAIDLGDPKNIHPADKLDVGLRLALAAQHIAYGKDLVYSGPLYDKMAVEGNSIRLSLTQRGGGLIIGTAPWTAPGVTPPSSASLVGFTIAGQDRKWEPATARIDGDTVVVASSQVPNPVAVRYAWAAWPPQGCNLYNKEGLPASPFRTDDWDDALGTSSPSVTANSTTSQVGPNP